MESSGAELLLDLFQKYGIDTIFCSPGSEWVPLWDGLTKRYEKGDESITYVNCRHEELAVSMAWGYGKATGRLPAVLLHAGVGPLHASMAIRNAYQTQAPMLICSSQISGHRESEEVHAPGPHWISQLSDPGGTGALIHPYIKWSNTVHSKDTMLDAVYRGCKIAQTSTQGPVFLSVSAEILLKSFPKEEMSGSAFKMSLPEADSNDLEEIAHQLLVSKKPMIITEHAGEKPEAVEKLVELAELLSIPVFESVGPLYANFPKDHPLYLGHDPSEALKDADTIFVIGASTPWYPPSKAPSNGAKVILLDKDAIHESLTFWGYRADWTVSADITHWLAKLITTIRRQADSIKESAQYQENRLEECQMKHSQLSKQWREEAIAGENSEQVSPKWLFFKMAQSLPDNAIIVEETITHSLLIHRYLAEKGRFVRACMGGLGMGIGVAVGTKLAYKKNPVIFIVGDGTFNYNPVVAGLGVCQEYDLPMLLILLNNSSYHSMKQRFIHYRSKKLSASNSPYLGVDIKPSPDYKRIAEAFDAHGETVEKPDQIKPALKRALQQVSEGRSALLDVRLETE
jgi:acetolactate synthase-1/2/3 large subunit